MVEHVNLDMDGSDVYVIEDFLDQTVELMLMSAPHSLAWGVPLVRMVLGDLHVFVLLEGEERDVKFVS